jgi:1-aminocyclopropane-1-carboxylate deaminase/D-cysteine desulfhydrase-like pyridoxal-dependent ACC family enzyme
MLTLPMTRAQIRQAIARIPRIRLAHLPTPLQPCPRASRDLGIELLIKRDDLTGLAFGGNKTRNLEFRMAEARNSGADVLVFGVEVGSNSARQTAAAANMLGLPVVLVLRGRPDTPVDGNLLVDYLLGAEVRIVDLPADADLDAEVARVTDQLREQGRRPFDLNASPMFARASALAYMEALLEIQDQLGAPADFLYMCSGSKGMAGLLLGQRLTGESARVVAVSATYGHGDPRAATARIANETADLLGLADVRFTPGEVNLTTDYVGETYGIPTPAGNAAILYLARTEGILLDPVYTGKAFAGLLDHVRTGRITRGARVVFVHTGGQPALFSFSRALFAAGAGAPGRR